MKLFLFFFIIGHAFAAIPTKEQQFADSLLIVLSNASRPDVRPGMVVASPSREAPNYYYDWVRDTSLTMKSLIDYYEITKKSSIKSKIVQWVYAEEYRQNLPTFSGLGEPKYNIDGSGFTGAWGRPQNDGPALRALAMIKFARILLKEGDSDLIFKTLYHGHLPADSVIKKDLEYVAHHWRESSFDLWEEEKGMHFYTLLSQHVALQEGALFAQEMNDLGASEFYQQESIKIGQFIKDHFLDERVGLLVSIERSSTLGYKNSGLDIAPLLGLIHTSPYQNLFRLNDPFVVVYVKSLIKSFADLYAVNRLYNDLGISLGRYPEDRYDGYQTTKTGNPWFLSTMALGEYYCQLKKQLKQNPKKQDDLIEKQFQRVLFHSDREGHLSEQFHHENGLMQGAVDLTWSHNSFMTAMMSCGFIR